LAEIGPHYDSLNECVIPAVKNAAPAALPRAFTPRPVHAAPVFAAHLPRKKGLPPVRSGAIMKLR
jgi:hypothetical protein